MNIAEILKNYPGGTKLYSPICGECLERDTNAAINILIEGLRTIGVRSTEFTLADCPTMDDRLKDLRSSGRLKQEEKTNFY